MLVLTRVVQTSIACPAQWNAWDAAGNYYYLRYRGGHGQVKQYRTADWVNAAEDELVRVVADFRYGHELDGCIELAEFAELAGIVIAEGAMITGIGDYWRDELILRGVISPSALEEGSGK